MTLDLSRRDFIKKGVVAGVTLYSAPVLAKLSLSSNGTAMVAPELVQQWQQNGKAKFRLDAIAKVTGEKIYGRDLHAVDMPNWPSEQAYAYCIRLTQADRIFEGVDLSTLPAELQPELVITAEDLARDNIVLPGFYGTDPLAKTGQVADYLGQAAVMLIFPDFRTFDRAKNFLQFQHENVVKYGAKAPLAATHRNPWATHRLTRIEGNPNGTLPDKYSPLKNGLPAVPYENFQPVWPAPNPNGTPLEQQMAAVAEIEQDFHNTNNYVLARTYETQFIDPMFMEAESFNGWYDEKTQTMHAVPTLQSVADFQENAANMLAKHSPLAGKVKNLVVHSPYVGGGFGGKDHSITAYYGLLAAIYSKKPVRLALDRFEQFQTGLKRHPFTMQSRLAVDKNTGKFQALSSNMALDGGGRANLSSAVASVGASGMQSVYYFPKNDLTAVAYPSENPAAGSMRGFGTVQTMFAMEMLVNEAAADLGIDPIDLRLKNIIKAGQANTQGGVAYSAERYAELLNAVKEHPIWSKRAERKQEFETENPNLRFGTGFAICTKKFGTGTDAPASYIELKRDGTLIAGVSAMEMGTGTQTAQALVTAEYLGRGADVMNLSETAIWDVLQMEQTMSPWALSLDYQEKMQKNPRWVALSAFDSAASNSAYYQSKTTVDAAKVIFRYGLWPAAKAIWGKLYFSEGTKYSDMYFGSPEDASWVDGKLTSNGMMPLDLATLAEYAHNHGLVTAAMVHSFNAWAWVEADFTIEGNTQRYQLDAMAVKYGDGASPAKKALMASDGWHLLDRHNTRYPDPNLKNAMATNYAPCATVVDIIVEPGSGKVDILRSRSWVDAGKVIVPELVEGQLEGGIVMGLGQALYEYLPSGQEGAGNGTWNLNRYHVPTADQVGVWQMDTTILPPVGDNDQRKGIAEVAMIPVIPAIVEALYQVTHKRFYHLPITAEEIQEAVL